MSVETKPYPPGSLVRVIEDHEVDGSWVYKGAEYTVTEFVPAGDPEDDELPYDWYWVEDAYGSNREVRADKVELVKTAEQMAARRIPTAEQIIAQLHCLGDYEGFELNAADSPDIDSREISGMTDDGLRFAFTITVSSIYQADF